MHDPEVPLRKGNLRHLSVVRQGGDLGRFWSLVIHSFHASLVPRAQPNVQYMF